MGYFSNNAADNNMSSCNIPQNDDPESLASKQARMSWPLFFPPLYLFDTHINTHIYPDICIRRDSHSHSNKHAQTFNFIHTWTHVKKWRENTLTLSHTDTMMNGWMKTTVFLSFLTVPTCDWITYRKWRPCSPVTRWLQHGCHWRVTCGPCLGDDDCYAYSAEAADAI